MREAIGNMWDDPAPVKVVTINLCVKADGALVMGRGCAAEAARRWPELPAEWGRHVHDREYVPTAEGVRTRVCLDESLFPDTARGLIAFPVKAREHTNIPDGTEGHPGWMCGNRVRSTWCRVEVMRLILANLRGLVSCARVLRASAVAMPRLGCGFGGLSWLDVSPWLAACLDDRFVVYGLPGEASR